MSPGRPGREPRISDSTVRRLSAYYRILEDAEREGLETVSSFDLAERAGVTPAQVRKDLSFFGQFGKRGTGYPVRGLHERLRAILGLTRRWNVCLVGAGNLAHALHAYKHFSRLGFEIIAIFDNDPLKVGRDWGGVRVQPLGNLGREIRARGIEVGIVTTPADAAQGVVDLLVKGGIRGILNFAPRKLFVPEGIELRNVHLAVELESLSFALK